MEPDPKNVAATQLGQPASSVQEKMEPDSKDLTAVKLAMDHAWAWFSLHATQRLQSVNFFLVAIAFLSAAFVTAAKEKMYEVASGVAILGVVTSYLFYKIELRIRYLLHASEDAIKPLQKRLVEALDIKALDISEIVEAERPGEWKYSKVFWCLYTATGIAFALALVERRMARRKYDYRSRGFKACAKHSHLRGSHRLGLPDGPWPADCFRGGQCASRGALVPSGARNPDNSRWTDCCRPSSLRSTVTSGRVRKWLVELASSSPVLPPAPWGNRWRSHSAS